MFSVNQFKNHSNNEKPLSKIWKIRSINEKELTLIDELNETYIVNTYLIMNALVSNKFKIEDNVLYGEFIIDNNGMVCSKKEHDKWLSQTKKNKSNTIAKKDLKPGFIYQFEDKKTHVLYLGERYVAQWKIGRDGNITLGKVSKKHFGYEVYSFDQFRIKEISNGYKNAMSKKVIKEIKEHPQKGIVNKIFEHFKYSESYVYLSEEKPKEELDLYLKEVSKKDLFDIQRKTDLSFLNVFHKIGHKYVLNNYFVYKENEEDSYSRQISKSDSNSHVFEEPFDNKLIKHNETESYYSYKTYLRQHGSRCDNDNFVIAPENYYMLTI